MPIHPRVVVNTSITVGLLILPTYNITQMNVPDIYGTKCVTRNMYMCKTPVYRMYLSGMYRSRKMTLHKPQC